MNERIKELVEQAPYTTISTEGRLFTQQDLAKFTELIVRECAVLCDNHGNKVEDERPNKDLSSAAFDCSDIIRDHFGVKE